MAPPVLGLKGIGPERSGETYVNVIDVLLIMLSRLSGVVRNVKQSTVVRIA